MELIRICKDGTGYYAMSCNDTEIRLILAMAITRKQNLARHPDHSLRLENTTLPRFIENAKEALRLYEQSEPATWAETLLGPDLTDHSTRHIKKINGAPLCRYDYKSWLEQLGDYNWFIDKDEFILLKRLLMRYPSDEPTMKTPVYETLYVQQLLIYLDEIKD